MSSVHCDDMIALHPLSSWAPEQRSTRDEPVAIPYKRGFGKQDFLYTKLLSFFCLSLHVNLYIYTLGEQNVASYYHSKLDSSG